MRRLRFITAFLALFAVSHGQEPVEVRPAEPVGAVASPTPEVRRAQLVTPPVPGSATALPPVDATDGTEAIRAAPSNLAADPARQALLELCEDCRVLEATNGGIDPYAGAPRPVTKTTEDYLREAERAKRSENET